MYKVEYKVSNGGQAWQTHGSYSTEQTALSAAARISAKYFMVRVLDPNRSVVWSG